MNKSKTDLTQERVRELFDYDAENGILIRKKDNHGRIVNRSCGHKPVHSAGYGQVNIDGKIYFAHRVIWLWHYGELPEFIDHIDRDPMNNRFENLREATRAENNQNASIRKDNSSGFRGVYYHKATKKYQAKIKVGDRQIYLGLFTTPEEAYRAYQLSKIKYHPNSPIAQQYRKELGLD